MDTILTHWGRYKIELSLIEYFVFPSFAIVSIANTIFPPL